MCKVILVVSLSLSQAEQKHESSVGTKNLEFGP